MEETFALISEHFPIDENKRKSYGPLAYAYIGDCVYDLIIKTMIISRYFSRPGAYHREAVHYVNAHAQAEMMSFIRPLLKDDEIKIYRRGRNARPHSMAKNQTPHDYRMATAFECLIGYLYISGSRERLIELVGYGLDQYERLDMTGRS